MARTTVPTVVAGNKITAAFGNAVAAAVSGIGELQDDLPEASTSFAPATVAGLTKGNGTEVARYAQFGALVVCGWTFTLGSSSAITGDIVITLPVSNLSSELVFGTGRLEDISAPERIPIHVHTLANTNVIIRPIATGGTYALVNTAISSTVPFTWASGDKIIAAWAHFAA